MLENGDEGRRDEIPFLVVFGFQNIQPDGILRVRRIEIHDFIRPALRNEMQDVLDELAVRVYDANAMSAPQVLYRHVLQESAFPRARLSDDVDVMPTVILLDTELDAARVARCFAESQNFRLKKRPTDL
jgi:hypothetical protein